ncbi:MAG: PEFG-CTERM sorting domain-containing protein, partial [Thaumarchaeota archaeon]|nr:PEFG-CTERM sorting domain-containing protein [Nitrososphaerota archaeon]
TGDLGVPSENTTDLGPGPAGNLTNTPAAQAVPNSTSSTVPEFGPMVSLILVASIVSIIIFSARTRLRF